MTAAEIMTQCCPSLTKAGTREAAQQVLMAILGTAIVLLALGVTEMTRIR